SYKGKGYSNAEISHLIGDHVDVATILRRSAKPWDVGCTTDGILGSGDAFVMRDPSGIRRSYYYIDDEVVVVTSERPAIQTAFNVKYHAVKEINPGHALIIKKNGEISEEMFREPEVQKSCSFERIYFSRGSDAAIYKERKELGRLLCPQILSAVNNDLKNTVVSFIPNTAEVAFYGMVDGLYKYVN